MKFDPEKLVDHMDLMRIAGLKHKPKSEEEKRYPTFNTRMMAATVDLLLLSLTLAPVVDYVYLQVHGSPPITMNELVARYSGYADTAGATQEFIRAVYDSGFWSYWKGQMSWHLYVMMSYAVLCWHFWSATPGKMLFRLVVVDRKTYKPLSDWQSIVRVFGYILSMLPFGLGILWMAFDKEKRGWHDLICRSVVIKKQYLTSAIEAAHPLDSPAPSEAE